MKRFLDIFPIWEIEEYKIDSNRLYPVYVLETNTRNNGLLIDIKKVDIEVKTIVFSENDLKKEIDNILSFLPSYSSEIHSLEELKREIAMRCRRGKPNFNYGNYWIYSNPSDESIGLIDAPIKILKYENKYFPFIYKNYTDFGFSLK